MTFNDDLKTQFDIIEQAAKKHTETLESIMFVENNAKFTEKKEENDSIYFALGFVRAYLFPDENDDENETE